MSIIAIIPARGGSKGIPRKNLIPVAGKPLLAWSLEDALDSRRVQEVIVSTDDKEIEQLARRYGCSVVRRPQALSGDEASSESALLHALDDRLTRGHEDPQLVVFLQCTSPVRGRDDIDLAIAALEQAAADSLFSSRPVHGFTWRQGISLQPNYDPRSRPRRQDLSELTYEENGSIYVFKPWVLRDTGSRLGGKIAMHPMHALDSFQIDEPDDVPYVDALLRLRRPTLPQANAA